jgi:hypothetical protein
MFKTLGIAELEKLFDEKRQNVDVLTSILAEVSHRRVPRARDLKRRVMSALSVSERISGVDGAADDVRLLEFTPAQHRRLAEIYRAGSAYWTDEERDHATKLAEHHEMVANGMERRIGKTG